jgi:hypothetical protein
MRNSSKEPNVSRIVESDQVVEEVRIVEREVPVQSRRLFAKEVRWPRY